VCGSPTFWGGRHGRTFTALTIEISASTADRFATPGNVTSGSAISESVGQNSGLFLHWVHDSSGHEPLRISHRGPFDLTMVEHFGHFVCIVIICSDVRPFSTPVAREKRQNDGLALPDMGR
jgi:hypothetical protein